MSWISALSLSQWVLLLAIPPAVLSLYFLKLKRKQVQVSSTLLWRRTIEDLHVNSIWQKLKNNLLLYLQLLFLLLLIVACLRPGWSGSESIGERRIYIIDNSASMQSTDVAPSRLEQAKAKVRSLISGTAADDVGMVIAFSDRADVRQGFTKDRNRLLEAVNSIQPTNHPTDVGEALRAASGLANPGRASFDELSDVQLADAISATVYLMSDGAFGSLDDLELGQLKIEYVAIGSVGTGNVGILSFAVQRNESDKEKLEAYARIGNFSQSEVECIASLHIEENLIDASTVKIPADGEVGVVFEISNLEEGTLKLSLDHQDSMMVDNTAYAAVRPTNPINILLVTPGNNALESALTTGRCQRIANVRVESLSFLKETAYTANDNEPLFDLIIYDQCSPEKMPEANTLFIGSAPPGAERVSQTSQLSSQYRSVVDEQRLASGSSSQERLYPFVLPAESVQEPLPATSGGDEREKEKVEDAKAGVADRSAEKSRDRTPWKIGPSVSPVIVLDVNRTNPITQFLEMGAVGIVEGNLVEPPEGGTILMTSDSGPIFAVHPRGPYQDAVLGFGLAQQTETGFTINTDWSIKRSFPVFVYSVVEYLGGGITEASAPTVLPGNAIGLMLSTRYSRFDVELPSGERKELVRNDDARFTFTQTDQIGTYHVFGDNPQQPLEAFCVNLFSNRESNLSVSDSVSVSGEKIDGVQNQIRARQELWRWILVVGIIVLLFEWVLFNKRIFI